MPAISAMLSKLLFEELYISAMVTTHHLLIESLRAFAAAKEPPANLIGEQRTMIFVAKP
jgi:hypothetical protein